MYNIPLNWQLWQFYLLITAGWGHWLINYHYSYTNAAKCYAQAQVSFEEVALKFIQVEERQALRMFLLKKLDSLKNQVRLTDRFFFMSWYSST